MLLLDGTVIHEGGFKAGIDVTLPVAPGQHRLESAIVCGSISAATRQGWDVAVPWLPRKPWNDKTDRSGSSTTARNNAWWSWKAPT